MTVSSTAPNKTRPAISRPEGFEARPGSIRFTIATLVNDRNQYDALLRSLISGGFDGEDCEYLFIDNTVVNEGCGYSGLNAMLNEARGRYVILCHQDIRLLTETRSDLDARLAELETRDPLWALAGNAGGVGPGELAIRITDPHGANQRAGTFPALVTSLDENFIVVKRSARIGFSVDLKGFHFYGADICLHAAYAGHTAYVIDFHLAHLSAGQRSEAFEDMEEKFRYKWEQAMAPRWIQTTCSLLRLSGGTLGQIAGRIADAPYAKIARRLPHARSWLKTGTGWSD